MYRWVRLILFTLLSVNGLADERNVGVQVGAPMKIQGPDGAWIEVRPEISVVHIRHAEDLEPTLEWAKKKLEQARKQHPSARFESIVVDHTSAETSQLYAANKTAFDLGEALEWRATLGLEGLQSANEKDLKRWQEPLQWMKEINPRGAPQFLGIIPDRGVLGRTLPVPGIRDVTVKTYMLAILRFAGIGYASYRSILIKSSEATMAQIAPVAITAAIMSGILQAKFKLYARFINSGPWWWSLTKEWGVNIFYYGLLEHIRGHVNLRTDIIKNMLTNVREWRGDMTGILVDTLYSIPTESFGFVALAGLLAKLQSKRPWVADKMMNAMEFGYLAFSMTVTFALLGKLQGNAIADPILWTIAIPSGIGIAVLRRWPQKAYEWAVNYQPRTVYRSHSLGCASFF